MIVIRIFLPAIALVLVTLSGSTAAKTAAARRLSIAEQRVIRIPLHSTAVPLPRLVADYTETRGPKCVARSKIAGATLNGTKSIDITLKSQTRLRAKLKNSCPALDYYAGFYLNPTADGDICSDRDSVHARSGGECQIDVFRKLSPKKRRAKP